MRLSPSWLDGPRTDGVTWRDEELNRCFQCDEFELFELVLDALRHAFTFLDQVHAN